MNFYFPDRRALCMAENATHNLHNILTPRGAQVRDARMWSRYLAEAIELFAADSDVVFASHHWPTWGTQNITTFMRQQRDLYAYLHDQTLRLLNQGFVASEIAEILAMPPASTPSGTPTATTAPPTTTSRRSTSSTWVGGTATPHTSGSTHPRPPAPGTSKPSAASTRPSPKPRTSPTAATYASPPSWPATPSSHSPTTKAQSTSWPTS